MDNFERDLKYILNYNQNTYEVSIKHEIKYIQVKRSFAIDMNLVINSGYFNFKGRFNHKHKNILDIICHLLNVNGYYL